MPNPNDKIKQFLAEQEGDVPEVYRDIQGNPTVGVGTNLNSPEVPGIMEKMGISHEDVKSGERQLTPEEQQLIHEQQLADKKQYFENIKKRDFPNAQISSDEMTSLQSLMYNSPELIGPSMRDLLNQNKKEDVAKEILLRSNKYKVPGLEKRRLEEAEQYSGPNFENIVKSLTPDEIGEIRGIIGGIKNFNERQQVMERFPFLKDIMPSRPYRKVFKKP